MELRSRRGVHAGLGGACGLLLLACLASCQTDGRGRTPLVDLSDGPPDLIILAVDTFRADHLGLYGNEWVQTPNLDAFAREAVVFDDCASTSTWTLPSFATLFTGRLPVEHFALGGKDNRKLNPQVATLAEILQVQRFRTTEFVAVDWLTEAFGLSRGFEQRNNFVSGKITGRWDRYAKRVFNTIAAPKPKRHFLFVHWYDAHDPYRPPPPFSRMYYSGQPNTRPEDPARDISVIYDPERSRTGRDPEYRYRWLKGIQDLDFPVKEYAAGVTHVDSLVGAVVDSLRVHDRLDKSIVVVLADHGEHLTEHDIYFTHRFAYEECLRVPLLIRLPNARQAGHRVTEPVSLVDVLPTLLELMGIAHEQPTDGMSLVGAMRGEEIPERVLFAEYGDRPDNWSKAVWDAKYRYSETNSDGQERVELFDRQTDRLETQNIAATRRDLVEYYSTHLDGRFGPERRLLAGDAPVDSLIDPETAERLRALGYID